MGNQITDFCNCEQNKTHNEQTEKVIIIIILYLI